MTRDQIQKRIEMIIEEEFFKYQDSHSVRRSAKRIMRWWDNGFAYELKSPSLGCGIPGAECSYGACTCRR